MRRFDVAVLGVGYWGKKIVDEYTNIPGVHVKAVSDQVDANLEFCRDRYGVSNLYRDYREVLQDDEIVAVNVCLPNKIHFQACKDALEAGKHVLVEKPITLSSREGQELVDLASDRNLTLSVGHIYRFNNALLEMRRLMSQRFFGRPYLMNFVWMNLEQPFPDRDVIVDLAPHFFDMFNFSSMPGHKDLLHRKLLSTQGEWGRRVHILRDASGGDGACNFELGYPPQVSR
jgi:predicted dehydrogenase